MKINRASPIERMIPTSFDGTKSKAKSTPDTTSTEIKKYKAVSLRSFTAWIIAQKSRKSIKIGVQTEGGLFGILAAFFSSSPPPYSLRFISSAVPVVAGAPRGDNGFPQKRAWETYQRYKDFLEVCIAASCVCGIAYLGIAKCLGIMRHFDRARQVCANQQA